MVPNDTVFHRDPPSILVVDRFYKDPDAIRKLALEIEYEADERYYKGLRSREKFLFPYVKERFEELLGLRIVDWLQQPANGSFQKTSDDDPLVWHSDTQHYAAAIYLTPQSNGIDPEHDGQPRGTIMNRGSYRAGTSFWSYLGTDRRPSESPARNEQIYSKHNLLHEDNWVLVDRVGHVYNRIVFWDAQLIHSATTYAGYSSEHSRLVQLFFFNVAR